MNILSIGYTTEGSTDEHFFGDVIRRTFIDVAILFSKWFSGFYRHTEQASLKQNWKGENVGFET